MANPAAVLRILVTANGAQAIGSLRAVEGQANKTAAASGRMGKAFATFAKVGFVAAAVGAVAAGKEFKNFQQAMTQVETQAGASHKEVVSLTGAVKELAKRSQFGPEDLAKGLYRVESAGFRGAHAMRVLNASQKLAAIGNSDLELTTKAVTATMNTNIKGAKGLTQTIGTLNAAVGQGDMRMNDLIGALSTGILPAAKSAGLGLRDVTGAIDIMTRRGVPAEAAATRLRMTFSLLGAPTKQAATALQGIGLSSSQLADDMRKPNGLVTALSDLKQHLKDSGDNATQANMVIARAFGGGRTSSAIQTLLQNVGELSKVEQDTTKHANDVNAAYQRQSQTVNAQLKTAWSSIQVLLINFGSKVAPMAARAVVKLADALSGTISFFSRNKTALAALKGALVAATAAWLAYRVAALYAAAATTIATGGLNLVVPALIAFGAAVAIGWQKSAKFRDVVTAAFTAVKTVIVAYVHLILTLLDKWLGGLQAVMEAASHLPIVGKKFRGIADDIGHAREKVRGLRDAVDNLNGRKVTVQVQVNALLSEFQAGKIPKLGTLSKPGQSRAMGGLVVGGSGSGDKVPLQAMVEPGEQVFVLNRNASAMLDYLQGVNASVPRFAAGGKLSLAHPGSQIRRAAVEMSESRSARWLKAHPMRAAGATGGRAAGNAQMRRWAAAGLMAAGVPATRANVSTIVGRMIQESGGNPSIVNTWDSNAAKGTPSTGLMQTIWPTFKAYHVAGTSWSMTDPVANVAAAVRYMLARYGHLVGSGPGGYQMGGLIASAAKTRRKAKPPKPPAKSRHWNPFKGVYQMMTSKQFKALQTRWTKLHPKQRMPSGPTKKVAVPKLGAKVPIVGGLGTIENLLGYFDTAVQAGDLLPDQAFQQVGYIFADALKHPQKYHLSPQDVEQLKAERPTYSLPHFQGETPEAQAAADTGGGDPNQPLIDALQADAEARQALADQLAGVQGEMKRQNDINQGVLAVSGREALRLMTDVLSNQVGYRVNTASYTPGFGVGARY